MQFSFKHVADGSKIKSIQEITDIPRVISACNAKLRCKWVRVTVDGIRKDIVLLGEAHLSSKGEARAVKRIYPFFDRIGVEGIDPDASWDMFVIKWGLTILYGIMSAATLGQRSLDNSIIHQAGKHFDDKTVELEKGFRLPLRTRLIFTGVFAAQAFSAINFLFSSWHLIQNGLWPVVALGVLVGVAEMAAAGAAVIWMASHRGPFANLRDKVFIWVVDNPLVIFADIIGIGGPRNRHMAARVMQELADPKVRNIAIPTGAAHTRAMERLFISEYGGVSLDFPPVS